MIAANGAGLFLHRFQQRRLRLRRRAVDFVSQQHVRKQRSANKGPRPMAVFVFFNDVGNP